MKTHYTLKFHPDVEADLFDSYSWYERKVNGLGDDFLQLFYSSIELIKEKPLQFPIIYKNFHRYLLHKFPYDLYYLIEEDLIIVMGLFHYARNPRMIESTLKDRTD